MMKENIIGWSNKHLNWVIVICYIFFVLFLGTATSIVALSARAVGLWLAIIVSIIFLVAVIYFLGRVGWAVQKKGYRIFSRFWGGVLLVIMLLIPLIGVIILLALPNKIKKEGSRT
jgi:hypothetical protein